MKKYDVIVIGSGPGGYVAAIKAAQSKLKVAIIEKQDIGGVCLNWGCIPTKALLKSAKVYRTFKNAEKYGIDLADPNIVKPNWTKMIKRKDDIVKRLTGGVKMLLEKNGVDIYKGVGFVKTPTSVVVNDETLETDYIILSTGASPIIPPIPGLQEAYEKGIVVTSKELLEIKEIPKELVIIGGGAIGVEFATIFSSYGTKVTIIERMDQILVNVDDEIRSAYLKILNRDSIEILTNASVTKVSNQAVTYVKDNQESTVNASVVLLSVGMKANSDQLEHLNLKMERSNIVTNDQLQTSIPNIYAIGDVNGKLMLAHVASSEGLVAVDHILGKTTKLDYLKIPAGVYAFPEIVWVGLTEQEAKSKNISYKVSKFPLSANGRALADGESEGFVKVISDKKYHEIIGVHILATNATDLIAEAVVTMELEGMAEELSRFVHLHPSISETIMEAAHGVVDKAIHIL